MTSERPQAARLRRVLAGRHVLALSFGAMIGWSWVALSGEWVVRGGMVGASLAFVVGGAAIVLIGLTYAELAAAMPVVGGEHAYSHRALGKRASFVCTWAIILGYVSVVAFEAVALPTAVQYLFPGVDRGYLWTVAGWDVHVSWVLIGIVGAAVMTAINCTGIRLAGSLQAIVTAVIVAAGAYFLIGVVSDAQPGSAAPFALEPLAGSLSVLVMVPFMFVGFDVIPQAAEEINLAPAKIGRLLVISVLLAAVWYVAIILGVGASLPDSVIAGSTMATADAAGAVWHSDLAAKLLVWAGIAGILTSWNALLVGASRAVFALASAGMLPAVFARLDPRTQTPRNALLFIGGLSCLAPLFGRPALVWLVNAGGLGIVTAYAFVAVSFLVLRRREPDMERPFRLRGGRTIGVLALLAALALAVLYFPGSPAALVWPQEWLIVIVWIALGAVLYGLARRRTEASSAA